MDNEQKKVLMLDVDLTVVNTLDPWFCWYEEQTGHNVRLELDEDRVYNVQEIMTEHPTPLDFWKIEELYHTLDPIPEALQAINILKDKYQIVFVSACFSEHQNSKKEFLLRHFPYLDGFISTDAKGYVGCFAVVDDYSKYLLQVKKQQPDAKLFMIQSPLNRNDKHFTPVGWEEIVLELMKDEG